MDRNELIKLHEDTCAKAREMMKAKNNDYAFGSDPFANFRGSMFIGIPEELGILMRSMDKFKRIETFVRSGSLAIKGESVDDTIEDVINYMILLKGIISDKIAVFNLYRCIVCEFTSESVNDLDSHLKGHKFGDDYRNAIILSQKETGGQ